MRPAYPYSSYRQGASPRDRAASALLTLAIVALIVLMLLRLGVVPLPVPVARPAVFQLAPERPKVAGSKAVAKVERESRGGAPRKAKAPVVPAAKPVPAPPVPPLNLLHLSKQELASLDTAMTTPHPAASTAGGGTGRGSTSGAASGAGNGNGDGPGGEQLYNADWYTKPTHAEMATYMPPIRTDSAWAEIACKTAPQYRVEDCQELGESPGGTGLSRALRQAAWQFKVLPPRIGGRAMIGVWVRIHFDWTVDGK